MAQSLSHLLNSNLTQWFTLTRYPIHSIYYSGKSSIHTIFHTILDSTNAKLTQYHASAWKELRMGLKIIFSKIYSLNPEPRDGESCCRARKSRRRDSKSRRWFKKSRRQTKKCWWRHRSGKVAADSKEVDAVFKKVDRRRVRKCRRHVRKSCLWTRKGAVPEKLTSSQEKSPGHVEERRCKAAKLQ